MRPKKVILLVGENETDMRILNYVFITNRYATVMAWGAQEAVDVMFNISCDILIIMQPLDFFEKLLAHSKRLNEKIPTIVLSDSKEELGLYVHADAVLCKPTAMELLERVRVMAQRKRGPRKGFKKLAESERIELTANALA